jgi:hypothetical protein
VIKLFKGAKTKRTFYLRGGLGNQLFIYYAGINFHLTTGKYVCFDTSLSGTKFTKHLSSLSSLTLPGDFVREKWPIRKLAAAANRLLAALGFPSQGHLYESESLGFDAALNTTQSKRIFGYFQSWKHLPFEPQGMACRRLELRFESERFKKLVTSAVTDRPITVHVRRGDYANLGKTIGLLSLDYYRLALERASALVGHSRVWIFSDDQRAALELLAPLKGLYDFVDIDASNVSDEEALVLMSHGSLNIIGNSTFSYFAAATNPTAIGVLYPEPWFLNSPVPEQLCPPNWIPVDSYFEEMQ